MHDILHILEHSFIDSLKLIPFLFITYMLMEYLEHKSEDVSEKILKRSGQFGSLIGASLGLLPQCGFSSAAAGLYGARVISLGTLMAVFLSTSDEMIPILLSHSIPFVSILKIILVKFSVALVVGLLTDLILRVIYKRISYEPESKIEEFCEREDCHCHKGIVKPALVHTLKVGAFIFAITLVLNLIIHLVGEENIASVILNQPILANVLAALVGIIPNCASSIIISELFVDGILPVGAMLSGLLVNSGVAIAVLFRTNRPRKDSVLITLLLLAISVAVGIFVDLTPLSQWLAI